MCTHQPAPVAFRPTTRTYSNVALTIIAGLLAVIAFDPMRPSSGLVSEAAAQQSARAATEDGALVSAAEQRKVMIAELRNVSMRLEKVEATLKGGLNVKVTEMPPLQLPAAPAQ